MSWSTIISIALGVLTAFGGGTGTGMWLNSGTTPPAQPTQPPVIISTPLPSNGQCVLTFTEYAEMLAKKRTTPMAVAKQKVQENPGLFGLFK